MTEALTPTEKSKKQPISARLLQTNIISVHAYIMSFITENVVTHINHFSFIIFQMATALLSTLSCGTCENQAAKFYCNTCREALCATCKTHHLRSRGSKYCDIVPYAQKLNPNYLANLLCHTHSTDAAEYWCDTCDVPICGSCITEEQHRGHHFSKITVVLSRRRDLMREDMKDTPRSHGCGMGKGSHRSSRDHI